MFYDRTDILFIGVWALTGSVLGFCSFNNTPDASPMKRFGRCCLSIGIGLFVAFPLYEYLQGLNKFSKSLNIMLSGLGAFGLPDIILKYWPRIADNIIVKIFDRENTVYHRRHNDEEE